MSEVMFTSTSGTPLKMNEAKPRVSLVNRAFIYALAPVFEYGCRKYGFESWKEFTPEQAKQCLADAAGRHLLAYYDNETHDPESGLHHLAQCAWNCLCLLYHEER